MAYEIEKIKEYRGYRIVNEKGDVIQEFDAYNYQAPLARAKEWIKNQTQKVEN